MVTHEIIIWYNETSNAELSEMRISRVFCAQLIVAAMVFAELFFAKLLNVFAQGCISFCMHPQGGRIKNMSFNWVWGKK